MTEQAHSHIFRFNSERQKHLYSKLKLISPSAATFYKNAYQLLETEPLLEATTHIISHLFREIESSIRSVLVGFLVTDLPPENGGQKHIWEIKKILEGFEIPFDHPVAAEWLKIPRSDFALDKLAHRADLAPPRPFDENYLQFLDKIESVFILLLDNYEARYLDSQKILDPLLTLTDPSSKNAKWLKTRVANNPVTMGYFFDGLTSEKWLMPLAAENFFKHPPEPEQIVEGDRVSYNHTVWAQSRYLTRISSTTNQDVQQQIVQVLLQIQTENLFVHSDIIDAACRLPGELAAQVSRHEKLWIDRQNDLSFLLPEKLSNLVAHLAGAHQIDAALELTGAALAILPDPAFDFNNQEKYSSFLHPTPSSRIEEWDYQRFLVTVIQPLSDENGLLTINLFAGLLETAIINSRLPNEENLGGKTYSDIWRRSIESSEDGLRNLLVSSIRSSAEKAIVKEAGLLPKIIESLESHQWLIFKRIVLHLLNLFPENAADYITEYLINEKNFSETEIWHEYISLLQQQFPKISIVNQDKILSWIDGISNVEAEKNSEKFWDGKELTDEQAEQQSRWRKLKYLEPLREVLPEAWKVRYDKWTNQLETPDHPMYNTSPVQMSWGYSSPRTATELSLMTIEELVKFLSDWKPAANDWVGNSPEGLGQEITSLVASQAKKFAGYAESFEGLAPKYVRAFLGGISSAINQNSDISWTPVFNLCNWVIAQQPDATERDLLNADEKDKWSPARAEIIELLQKGLNSETVKIPFEFRQDVWNLLKPLTDDPQLGMQNESESDDSNSDHFGAAINSIRGEAIRTVVRYAFWVNFYLKQNTENNDEKIFVSSFDNMPEVQSVLEYHLNLENDSSLAIRSVYGESIPHLTLLDASWVTNNLATIFPKESKFRSYYNAAWGTYLKYNHIYDSVFKVIRNEYEYAVDSLIVNENIGDAQSTSENTHLADHLIVQYFWGNLEITEPQSLLSRFYVNASDDLRAHIFWEFGRNFAKAEIVSLKAIKRFLTLIRHRIETAECASDKTRFTKEMRNLGWAFASKKFPPQRIINILKRSLAISGYSEPDSLVIEYLASLSDKYPVQAFECADIMVQNVKKDWKISHWSNNLKTILKNSLQSDAKKDSTILINKLAARGHRGFNINS